MMTLKDWLVLDTLRFGGAITLALAYLKLTHQIEWNWAWVIFPLAATIATILGWIWGVKCSES